MTEDEKKLIYNFDSQHPYAWIDRAVEIVDRLDCAELKDRDELMDIVQLAYSDIENVQARQMFMTKIVTMLLDKIMAQKFEINMLKAGKVDQAEADKIKTCFEQYR